VPTPSAGLPGIPPLLLPPLALDISATGGLPVAGQTYQVSVAVTVGNLPVWGVGLHIWLSAGLTMAGSVPPGCIPVTGGLWCGFAWLPGAQTITLGVTVAVASSLPAGTETAISAFARYDWASWASTSLTRQVLAPSPKPTHPHFPPPRHHRRPPPPKPAPTPSPHPKPSHRPRPASPGPAAVPGPPAPPPPAPPHKHRPHPSPSVYRAQAVKPVAPPAAPPSPVIPLGVLVTAVITPCVASAVTRFGKGVHGPRGR
jgi:hypothetical protein